MGLISLVEHYSLCQDAIASPGPYYFARFTYIQLRQDYFLAQIIAPACQSRNRQEHNASPIVYDGWIDPTGPFCKSRRIPRMSLIQGAVASPPPTSSEQAQGLELEVAEVRVPNFVVVFHIQGPVRKKLDPTARQELQVAHHT